MVSAAGHTYPKIEKLKSRKLAEALFNRGRSFTGFPVKVYYLKIAGESDYPVKIGMGASSRNFKKSVDRNHIKRQLREAYRTEKLPLHEYLRAHQLNLAIFLLYVDKTLPEKGVIKAKMPVLLQQLIKAIHEETAPNT